MRKGKGELTYKQLLDENKRLREENSSLKLAIIALRNDLHSRTVAYNKLLKKDGAD